MGLKLLFCSECKVLVCFLSIEFPIYTEGCVPF